MNLQSVTRHFRAQFQLLLSGAVLLVAAGATHAQYARPGAISPAPPQQVTAPGATAADRATAHVSTLMPLAPYCFEIINPNDIALANALRANALLCPAITKTGSPVHLFSTPAGELTAGGSGAPTVLHRVR